MASNKTKKVLLLCHPDLIPPVDQLEPVNAFADYATEHDVYRSLTKQGHNVKIHGLVETDALKTCVDNFQPDVCFNLMEEFDGDAMMDSNVVAYLEMIGVAYTGSNPKGLTLARDKSLSKKILEYHSIPTPKHFVVKKGKKPKKTDDYNYPLFVKSLSEEASFGISQASLVKNFEALCARVEFIHEKIGTDAIVDEFIEGRELYLALLGNKRIKDFPLWEMDFGELTESHQKIASRNTKWNEDYRKKNKIDVRKASNIPEKIEKEIIKTCKKAYEALEINGYARFDIRLKEDGSFYIIEANPNPNIGEADEFALASAATGQNYPELLEEICHLGILWSKSDS